MDYNNIINENKLLKEENTLLKEKLEKKSVRYTPLFDQIK